MKKRLIIALLAGATLLPALQGCFPVVAAGIAGSVLAGTDRRTLGTQTEDETLEWKTSNRLREKFSERSHINVTSYNRKVLLSGEVPSPEMKAEAERIAASQPNVRGVFNELTTGNVTSYSNRSNDAFITSKVKARFIDAARFSPNHVKVVTEARTVFLLGLLTQREAQAAIDLARTTRDVAKVVSLVEIISDGQARELDPPRPDPSLQSDPDASRG